jgi:hypothetical protein
MSLNKNLSSDYKFDQYQSSRLEDPGTIEHKESYTSPSKKHRSLPVMRSPEKIKNPLPTPTLHGSPQSGETTAEEFKSPVGTPLLRVRSLKSPSDEGDSPRSAKSPRSPRSEHEVMSSRRHRIDSAKARVTAQPQVPAFASLSTTVAPTVTQTVTQTVTSTDATNQTKSTSIETKGLPGSPSSDVAPDKLARQRLSAPARMINLPQPLPEQMEALADLWIQKLLGSSSDKGADAAFLTVAKINSLGRTDGKVASSALSEILQDLKVSEDKQGKVDINGLLRAMLANHLARSDAGKTIHTMQITVMHAHPKLAAIHFDDLIALDNPDKEKAVRQEMADTVKAQASACVDVAFGPSRQLSASRLPQGLLNFWKLIDARLVREAAKNPSLTSEQVLKARSNLGFDLLITRQMYPFALDPSRATLATEAKQSKVTARTALPVLASVFATTMADALLQAWPAFFTDAINHFDA